MFQFRGWLAGAVIALLTHAVLDAQVIRPRWGWPERLEVISSADSHYASNVGAVLAQVPVDDSHKWHVTLFVDDSTGSKQLESAFLRDPHLRAVADWAHFNVYRRSCRSQSKRFQAFDIDTCPTICVHTPSDSGTYPYAYVFRRAHTLYSPWGGDTIGLAQDIVSAIKGFCVVHNPGQCPGPWRPQPTPNVQPVIPLPNIPDIPPIPDVPDRPVPGEFPDTPVVTVIVDAESIGEEADKLALRAIALDLASQFPAGSAAKARMIDISDEEAGVYPVDPGDTPSIVVTNKGAITAFLTRDAVDGMRRMLDMPGQERVVVPPPLPEQPGMFSQLADRLGAFLPAGIGGSVVLLLALVAAAIFAFSRRGTVPEKLMGDIGKAVEQVRAAKTAAATASKEAATVADATVQAAKAEIGAAKQLKAELDD
jgi:hypothetical protein